MSYVECWVSYGGLECVLFPKDVGDFDGYMIAHFIVREVTNGVRLGRVQPGSQVTIKGKIISLNQAFRYLVRIKQVQGSDREEYEILADNGFRFVLDSSRETHT